MENETTKKPDPGPQGDSDGAAAKPARRRTTTRKPAAKKAAEPGKSASKLVVFFRHGIAEDPSEEKPDSERSLTTAGHDRTKRAARGLAKTGARADVILASPLLRALQTALWVTKAYGGKVKVQTTDALLPDGSPEDVIKLIGETEGKCLILVGHEPNLTKCAARLLGASGIGMNLRRAGCIAVLVDEEGMGTLEWMLAPRTLRGL